MSLKVIGAGFGRTGTMSLKAALEELGFNPCYHMVECFARGPKHWNLWSEAARGSADWDRIFEGFQATVDFPACTSYRKLFEFYPGAKVILGVRDPESWYASAQQTIFSEHWVNWLQNSEAADYIFETVDKYFDNRMHDRDHLVARFKQHIEEVKTAIPPERLLVFEARQGWEPLCEFLELPVPDGDFPRVNDNNATKEIIRNIMENGFQKVFGY